ncbi:MAG: HAMP domain-containing histidine kinase [Clostridiales bacterium]|nr:HAMP domain-containing histidine kinase [Clostridiales bacterium]
MKTRSLRSKVVIMASAMVTAACLFLTLISIASMDKYMRSIVAYDTASTWTRPDGDIVSGREPDLLSPANIEENKITYYNTISTFSLNSILTMLFTIVILAAAIYIVTGKILNPLSYLTHSICSIDEQNLRYRMELPKAIDEVYYLTQSFNDMMDRLELSYTAQKNFAANAAHELKTSLSIIKTSLQVLELQDNPSHEDYMEFTDDVKQSINRLISTVESLLTLTNSSLPDDTETINALAVADQIKNDLSSLADEKGVRITVNGDVLQLTYNTELFYRVIYNMAENAVKYNRRGGYVDITVSKNDKYILIKDNGIGMDSKAMENMFEPFYRSDLSRSNKVPGSGLGMSIVKVIMERYGGTLEISSTPEKGTEIKFKL